MATALALLGAILIVALWIPFTILAGAGSEALLTEPERWISPGDPAMAELGLGGATIASILVVGLWFPHWVLRRSTKRRWLECRALIVGWRIAIAASAMLLLVPATCLARRHGSDWHELRRVAWAESRRHSGREVPFAWDEFELVDIAGWREPVKLWVLGGGKWPKIRVDFGDGCVAHFDLRTMWCTYSD